MSVLPGVSDHLRRAWDRTWRDVWGPFTRHPSTPSDLLREAAYEPKPTKRGGERNGAYLTTPALNRIDLDLDLNSAEAAKGAFKALRPEDFKSSAAVARYLEAAVGVIEEFDEPGLGMRYIALVRRFVARYNLPYTMCDQPFALRPRLPCALDAAYRELEQAAAADPHLGEALDAFGKAWAEFFEAERPSDLKSAIDKASKLAEAFVGKRLGKSD